MSSERLRNGRPRCLSAPQGAISQKDLSVFYLLTSFVSLTPVTASHQPHITPHACPWYSGFSLCHVSSHPCPQPQRPRSQGHSLAFPHAKLSVIYCQRQPLLLALWTFSHCFFILERPHGVYPNLSFGWLLIPPPAEWRLPPPSTSPFATRLKDF